MKRAFWGTVAGIGLAAGVQLGYESLRSDSEPTENVAEPAEGAVGEYIGPPMAGEELADATPDSTTTTTEVDEKLLPDCVNLDELSDADLVGAVIMPLLSIEEVEELVESPPAPFSSFAVGQNFSQLNVEQGRDAGDTDYYYDLFSRAKRALADETGLPPILGLNDDGGESQLTKGLNGAVNLPSAQELGENVPLTEITNLNREQARWLLEELGINLNFGPVVGVASQPSPDSFGTDVEAVSRNATAAIEGRQQGGQSVAIKYFPAFGYTYEDRNPRVDYTAPFHKLAVQQLPVFTGLIERHTLNYLMMGRSAVPGRTGDMPAMFSPNMYELVRHYGFEGPIITDSLHIGDSYFGDIDSQVEGVNAALQAGADVVLVNGLDDAVAAHRETLRLVERDASEMAKITDSVRRKLAANGFEECDSPS